MLINTVADDGTQYVFETLRQIERCIREIQVDKRLQRTGEINDFKRRAV